MIDQRPSDPLLTSVNNPAETDVVDAVTREAASQLDRTQEVPRVAVSLTREEQDRRLRSELAKRGVPTEEIERLLALGAPTQTVQEIPQDLKSPRLEKQVEIHPGITLPEPRISTIEELNEASRILRESHLMVKRGQFEKAEAICRRALELSPSDVVALELYGDIYQSVGRVDDALFCYQRAVELAVTSVSAERKYGALMLLQHPEIYQAGEESDLRNPYIAVLFSLLFPGAGQLYNREQVKGMIVAFAMLFTVVMLGWTPYGFPGCGGKLTPSLAFFMLMACVIYLFSLIDANIRSTHLQKKKSGWDI